MEPDTRIVQQAQHEAAQYRHDRQRIADALAQSHAARQAAAAKPNPATPLQGEIVVNGHRVQLASGRDITTPPRIATPSL